jgi:hypothetical protein
MWSPAPSVAGVKHEALSATHTLSGLGFVKPSRDADPSHAAYLSTRPRLYRGIERRSQYLEMRDGVRIAIDVCLPRGHRGERLPTILRQTRYFRRFLVHPLLRRALSETTLDPMNGPMRALLCSRGYAWVDVDVRGSGASFGERPCPWFLDGEVADGKEIVDWITKQPWSNGRVGSTGVSYDGTTADFLATTGHPAVRAIAPRFSLFDVFTDVAFPGGLHHAYFTAAWEKANAALDRNVPGEMVALIYMLQAHGALPPNLAHALDRPLSNAALARALTYGLGGVAPVDADQSRRDLTAALASHSENYSVHDGAVHVTYRDDSPPNSPLVGQTSDYFSPHSYVERMRDVAVLSYGGFFDAGYAGAAVKRHHALSALGADSELLLGPWVHGGQLDMDPDAPGRATCFDHAAELLRFFDRSLLEEPVAGTERSARVRYYMMGQGRWCAAETWPPTGTSEVELCFSPGRRLAPAPVQDGTDDFEVDLSVSSGKRTRWRTLLCPFLQADGAGRSKSGYLCYDSDALDRDLDLVGHPVLVLELASSQPDFAMIAYLEDVTEAGDARILTEGQLRSLHESRLGATEAKLPRALSSFFRGDARRLEPDQIASHVFELLPLAMRIRRGHRLRLTLGGADVDHFATPPSVGPLRWKIQLSGSRLLLPVRV